jgi:energy-coupling factor transport system permease protein
MGLFKNMIPIFIMLYVLNVIWWSPPRANVLFYLLPAQKWFPFSYEAMVYSAGVILRFANVLIALWVIMLTTPISRFVLGFVKWRLPPSIAMGIGIGLASIPMLSQEIGMVLDAMKARAWEVEYRNPAKRIRAYVPLFVPILYQTITRAENIAVAIESRAFGYNIARRTYYREERMRDSDYLVLALGTAVTVFSIVIGVYGLGYGAYDFVYRSILALVK